MNFSLARVETVCADLARVLGSDEEEAFGLMNKS